YDPAAAVVANDAAADVYNAKIFDPVAAVLADDTATNSDEHPIVAGDPCAVAGYPDVLEGNGTLRPRLHADCETADHSVLDPRVRTTTHHDAERGVRPRNRVAIEIDRDAAAAHNQPGTRRTHRQVRVLRRARQSTHQVARERDDPGGRDHVTTGRPVSRTSRPRGGRHHYPSEQSRS